MIETLASLVFAHALADFVLQSDKMAKNKHRPEVLALHGVIVLATAVAATGSLHPGLLWLTAIHLAIDAVKVQLKEGLKPFLLDQAAHLASLAALATWAPWLWTDGLWGDLPALSALLLVLAGAILAIHAGGCATGLLIKPFAEALPANDKAESLPGAGRIIGQLERGLIFALILLGHPEGVGLLIAAKSILRFGAVRDDRALSEYVIIGTLASFAWAILVGYATLSGLSFLPPLGILPVSL
jgi:Protein of unknown function (DUF3307)